jgi:hypothetical protein
VAETRRVTYFPASPIAIRDATYDRLKTIVGLKSVLKAITKPIKDYNLPIACVYNAGERTEPLGDANCGEPRFAHRLHLGIDVICTATSEAGLDNDIIAYVEQIKLTLLSDTSWLEMFEAIERVDVSYAYPKETSDYLVQGMIEIELFFRSSWEPVAPNDFRSVTVQINTGTAPYDNPVYTQYEIP